MDNQTTRLEALLNDHLAQDTKRLDRIENKIDQLAEAVVAIARAEEQLIILERARMEITHKLDEHENRLIAGEHRLSNLEVTNSVLTKLFWIIVPLGVAYAGSVMLGMSV